MTGTHMDLVRAEYARTKTDHAHIDGCDDCGRGLDPARPSGWEFAAAANVLLCGNCVTEQLRFEQQAETRERAQTATDGRCSKDLHDMGDKANHYWTLNGHGSQTLRCRECYRITDRIRKAAARAAAKAAVTA